jgi:glycosyltransferase involved in cell wall biosynthesis
MRVLHVNTLFAPYRVGGAERSVELIRNGQIEAGIDAHVLTLQPPRTFHKSVPVTEESNIVRIALRNIYWPHVGNPPMFARLFWHAIDDFNVTMIPSISRALRSIRPDIIHTHGVSGFSSALWWAARSMNIPIAHSTRDFYLSCPRQTRFKNGSSCTKTCLGCRVLSVRRRKLTRLVDAFLPISHYMKSHHLDLGMFGKAKVARVIPNCFDESLMPLEPDHAQKEGKLRIGYLGRMVEHKGVNVLLDALRQLQSRSYTCVFAGLGEPDYVRELEVSANDMPVVFSGFMEPAAFYRECDVVVVPSIWNEPFSRVAVDALRCGVPVLCGNHAGTVDVVEDGVSGFQYDAWNSKALADKLRLFIENPSLRVQLSDGALASSSRFSIDTVVRDCCDAYRELLY